MTGPCACHSRWQNPLPTGKDEFAGATSTEDSGTLTPTPVVFYAATCVPLTAPATAVSLDNELFKQFMKAYLEVQVQGQIEVDQKHCKQSLKARFLNFYYSNSYIYCYQFC